MKTNPDIAQALTNLRASTDFQTVLDFLASERSKARDDCESLTDGPKLWRAQGRSVFVREFFSVVESAPMDLQKFKDKLL